MPVTIEPSNSTLRMLADLIHERVGLSYDSDRFDLLRDKISPLILEGKFDTILDYYYYLKYDDQSEKEWLRLQSALAINETYFWREYDQIRAVAEEIVPRIQREQPGRPVRIWHAACASGEEAYTMAIALMEAGCFDRGMITIHATDFNVKALSQARSGVYRMRSFRSIPSDILLHYFSPQGTDQYKLNDQVRALVKFSYLNLLDPVGMTQMADYDVIVCRNAFIYFSDTSVRQVARWFYRSLTDTGYLFVAAAESLLRLTELFELVEVHAAFAYQKRVPGSMPFVEGVNTWTQANGTNPPD